MITSQVYKNVSEVGHSIKNIQQQRNFGVPSSCLDYSSNMSSGSNNSQCGNNSGYSQNYGSSYGGGSSGGDDRSAPMKHVADNVLSSWFFNNQGQGSNNSSSSSQYNCNGGSGFKSDMNMWMPQSM